MVNLDGLDRNTAIIRDLMKKCADDTAAVINRVCDIAPEPHLPLAIGAGCAAVAAMVALMEPDADGLKEDLVLLAGLLLARSTTKENMVEEAMKDFNFLKAARRTAGDARI